MPIKRSRGRPKKVPNTLGYVARLKIQHINRELSIANALERLYKGLKADLYTLVLGAKTTSNYYSKDGLTVLIPGETVLDEVLLGGIDLFDFRFIPLTEEIEDKVIKLIGEYEGRVARMHKIKCPVCGKDT